MLLKQQYEIGQNELQLKKQELERYRRLHYKVAIASQEWESGKKVIFRQEMSGTADIITADLRLIERLLYQFRDIFHR